MTDISITAANVLPGSGAIIDTMRRAGATITAGKVVYFDVTDEKWKLADSNAAAAAARLTDGTRGGIALNGASDGQPLAVLTQGPITIGGTLTPGVAYYLSDTPGGICPVADIGSGEYAVFLGMALSASVLNLAIMPSGVSL